MRNEATKRPRKTKGVDQQSAFGELPAKPT